MDATQSTRARRVDSGNEENAMFTLKNPLIRLSVML